MTMTMTMDPARKPRVGRMGGIEAGRTKPGRTKPGRAKPGRAKLAKAAAAARGHPARKPPLDLQHWTQRTVSGNPPLSPNPISPAPPLPVLQKRLRRKRDRTSPFAVERSPMRLRIPPTSLRKNVSRRCGRILRSSLQRS